MATGPVRFSTKALSIRTWADYVRFFSRNGRLHCACMLYPRGGHLPARQFPSRAEWRVASLREMKQLVEVGRAHGILVYADGEAVGWCQYGRVDDLPVVRSDRTPDRLLARDPTSEWRITCFVTLMEYRRQGVASIALAAAVEAIRGRGGGWIEAVPIAFGHDDPHLRKLRRTYGWRSREVEEHTKRWPEKDVPGLGRVKAAHVTAKTGPHRGTMSMFERLGFEPTQRDGEAGVVMRLKA